MKSELAEKLISICETGSTDFAYGIVNLTAIQLKEVEAELIKHFEFSRIEWVQRPSFITEDKQTIVCSTLKLNEFNTKHTGKVGYVYTIGFTPEMYEPTCLNVPVKDGCTFGPILYDPITYEPSQRIVLTWNPTYPQDINEPARTYEDEKQSIRDLLEKVLSNPEEYKPIGFRGAYIRYAVI